jgi:hypothetical protein
MEVTFAARAFGIADTGATPQGCSARAAFQRLGCRVIGMATAKNDFFAITVNRRTIGGIVGVDLERGAAAAGLWGNGR